MTFAINIALLGFLLITAVAIVQQRDLLATVMLSGIYTLLCASLFFVMDAADVAFTEAAVGAGISTILMLSALSLTGGRHEERKHGANLPALFVVLVAGALLVYGFSDMPPFGSASAPAQQHVAPHYLDNTLRETGVPNVVTAILASYRGFDTLGELVVIFIACAGVVGLLGGGAKGKGPPPPGGTGMQRHTVLRVVASTLIPLILLFALYVQFHGDFSPGGGFQAGVIFASGIILFSMLFGEDRAEAAISRSLLLRLAAAGALLYGGVGFVALALGGNFLDYDVLSSSPLGGQHLGILLVELGVGITVAASITLIYGAFSRARVNGGQDDDR